MMDSETLWLWKNFVDGQPEYWAFDNAYPCHPNGDPLVFGEPCGYALVKSSLNGRPGARESEILARIKHARKQGEAQMYEALSAVYDCLNNRILGSGASPAENHEFWLQCVAACDKARAVFAKTKSA